jgi:hypothetical protein
MSAQEWLTVLVLVALGRCAVVDVGPLAAEGRSNEVAAQLRNQARTFRVRGIVESTGLRDVEHLEIHGAYFSATGDRVVERQPYIRLRDAAGHRPTSSYAISNRATRQA